ncbi:hypothetical protein ACFFRR_003488 [Megaselia abdita]
MKIYVFNSCSYISAFLVNRVSDELSAILTSVLGVPFYFINIETTRVSSGSLSDSHQRKFLTCALRIELRIVRLEGEGASTYTNQLRENGAPFKRRQDKVHEIP